MKLSVYLVGVDPSPGGLALAGAFGGVSLASWLLLLAGPLFFFVGIVGASLWLSVRGVDPADIAERVPQSMSWILLVVLGSLGVLFVAVRPVEFGAIWTLSGFTVLDVGVGAVLGLLLGVAYLSVLAPLLAWVQATAGDYVPPGSVLSTVSGDAPAFFVANVLLAPVVEETLYRGWALPLLAGQFGAAPGVALSCLLFGLLHWPGGVWYVLLTGALAGGLFSGLFLWSGSIWAPFAAHLALNLVEFASVWRDSDTATSLAV